MTLLSEAQAMSADLQSLRRQLHRIPEVGLQLPKTQAAVLAAIDGLGLEVTTGRSLTSVTAVLRGGKPGPAVLLRGDMDGLPVTERTDLEFSSEHEGMMHACGHDLHVAGLVGAARLLAARREDLVGDVVFMFQPGEEGFDGAHHMIKEGVLRAAGDTVIGAYGLHVMSALLPNGVFGSRPWTFMASSDGLHVRIIGAGGHGSTPHWAADPIPAAAEMVTALQTMVTRRFNIFDPVVVTVGSFHAGTKRNIIPDEAVFEATIRSFSHDAREQVLVRAVALCEEIALAHGLRSEVRVEREYPVTVNNPDEYEFLAATTRDLLGADRFTRLEDPSAGAEDFSRVLDAVPGCYVFLGATEFAEPLEAPGNHSPLARFDDSVLPDGAALLAELAVRRLARAQV